MLGSVAGFHGCVLWLHSIVGVCDWVLWLNSVAKFCVGFCGWVPLLSLWLGSVAGFYVGFYSQVLRLAFMLSSMTAFHGCVVCVCGFFFNLTFVYSSFIFFKFYLFIYLFLAVLGLCFCVRAFSSCGNWGPLFIAVHRPLTIAASLVAEHRLQTHRLSNCGLRA